jgi:hypothetical protein
MHLREPTLSAFVELAIIELLTTHRGSEVSVHQILLCVSDIQEKEQLHLMNVDLFTR